MSTETIEAPVLEPAVAEPIAAEGEAYLEWLEGDEKHPCQLFVMRVFKCSHEAVAVIHGKCDTHGRKSRWVCQFHVDMLKNGSPLGCNIDGCPNEIFGLSFS